MVVGWKSAAVMVVVMVVVAPHHVHVAVHGGGMELVVGVGVWHWRQGGHGGGGNRVEHLQTFHAVVGHLRRRERNDMSWCLLGHSVNLGQSRWRIDWLVNHCTHRYILKILMTRQTLQILSPRWRSPERIIRISQTRNHYFFYFIIIMTRHRVVLDKYQPFIDKICIVESCLLEQILSNNIYLGIWLRTDKTSLCGVCRKKNERNLFNASYLYLPTPQNYRPNVNLGLNVKP